MTTPYEQWTELRKKQEELQELVRAEFGRITVGPSGREGVYIRDSENNKDIVRITEVEAKFIIMQLSLLYGLNND